jgi:hypothetical protein
LSTSPQAGYFARSQGLWTLWATRIPTCRRLDFQDSRFPPRGPSGWFPRFAGNTEHSDFLSPIPPHFVPFVRRYRRCALGFAPAGARRSTCGPGGYLPDSPYRFLRRRRQDLPGSWRTPCERAVLFDPGGILTLGHYRASMLPSTFSTVSASATTVLSGLNHTAHAFAVYASQDELLHRHARLASGWLASLSGRDWHPLGPNERFQVLLPPFPGFTWRTGNDRKEADSPPSVILAVCGRRAGAGRVLQLGRDEFEILCLGSFDCSKGDCRVEGRQPSLIRYRQSKQIYIGDLTVALNVLPSEASPI